MAIRRVHFTLSDVHLILEMFLEFANGPVVSTPISAIQSPLSLPSTRGNPIIKDLKYENVP